MLIIFDWYKRDVYTNRHLELIFIECLSVFMLNIIIDSHMLKEAE